MGHLRYRSLLELTKLTQGIEIKSSIPTKIFGECIKIRLQWKPSQTPMTRVTEFLEKIHCDLRGPLSPIQWE